MDVEKVLEELDKAKGHAEALQVAKDAVRRLHIKEEPVDIQGVFPSCPHCKGFLIRVTPCCPDCGKALNWDGWY